MHTHLYTIINSPYNHPLHSRVQQLVKNVYNLFLHILSHYFCYVSCILYSLLFPDRQLFIIDIKPRSLHRAQHQVVALRPDGRANQQVLSLLEDGQDFRPVQNIKDEEPPGSSDAEVELVWGQAEG